MTGLNDDFADSLTAGNAPLGVLALGSTASGTLGIAGDRDWFAMSLTKGTRVQIYLNGEEADGTLLDTYLRIYSAGGDLIAFDDDSGLDPYSSFVSFTADRSNTFYAEAATYADASTGSYHLSLDLSGTSDGGTVLTGSGRHDDLIGSPGGDFINGRRGADTMTGGPGDDVYVVDSSGDVVMEGPAQGDDTVKSFIDYVLPANVENLFLLGTAHEGTGNSLGNTIFGNALDNVLDGGGGSDVLIGRGGSDTYYIDAGGQVIERSGQGANDSIISTASQDLGFSVATSGIETLVLTGAGAIAGRGNANANTIIGNDEANIIDGRGGNDHLFGNGGDDRFVVNSGWGRNPGRDVIDGGDGVDTISFEFLRFVGSVLINLSDQDFAYYGITIRAHSEYFRLDSVANVENVRSSGRADVLIDEAGVANVLDGGKQGDVYVVSDSTDVVVEGNDPRGRDLVMSRVDYALGQYVENLVLLDDAINGTGNALRNQIDGNDQDNNLLGLGGTDRIHGGIGNDVIDGGAGDDQMIGGDGSDRYTVDSIHDRVVEEAGEGHDSVESSISYRLTDNVEDLTLAGNGAIDGWGNDLGNALTGNSAANTLQGLEGNDVLDGQGGDDRLIGGDGNDTYAVDSAGDTVIEAANGGTDLVLSTITFKLTRNIENLTLVGTTAIDASGNDGDNVLTGNGSANTLNGGKGTDILDGGAGNDILRGGPGGDILTGGSDADLFIFGIGEAQGETITDFNGNRGDLLRFFGYGAGAVLTRADATHWSVDYGPGYTSHEIITFSTGADSVAGHYVFV